MDVRIRKGSTDPARIMIPSSKSLTHRALICASLAEGTSVVHCPADNQDTEATADCLRLFGARIEKNKDGSFAAAGGNVKQYDGRIIDCGESGSTLRFLLPLFCLSGRTCTFRLHGRLAERPLDVYEQLFSETGRIFEQDGELLTVRGILRPGEYTVRGDISSQFISGLLFALPLLEDRSVIRISGEYASRDYVKLSEHVLSCFGIKVTDERRTIFVPGRQTYSPAEYTVEGDDSAAAVFMALACLMKKTMTVEGVRRYSLQGDHRIVRYLRNMGAEVCEDENSCTVIPGKLKADEFDLRDCPDLGPVLFALAAKAEGESVFLHAGRLRYKESDRIEAMKEELGKMGVTLVSDGDIVRIRGKSGLTPAVLDGHRDHRVVMALSVLAAGSGEWVTIRGAEAVRKSCPGFFTDLAEAGADVQIIS